MKIENTEKVLQGLSAFAGQLKPSGLIDKLTLNELLDLYKVCCEIGKSYTVKDTPKQEEQTIIQKDILELKKHFFRNEVIESILKVVRKPLTPSELSEIAKELYDIHWYERSVCGFIQTAIQHGHKIVHVTNGGRRGKYVHSDFADQFKQADLLGESE